jgi:hypothetical protein
MRGGRWCTSLSALLLIVGCGSDSLEGPLASVQGRWTTTDDQYTDRAFEIDDDFLYLLQGGDTFSVHEIHDVRIVDDDLPRYTIEYRGDEGALFSFNFYLSQEEGGTILFPYQMHMKWRRDPNASVPWESLLDMERAARPSSD